MKKVLWAKEYAFLRHKASGINSKGNLYKEAFTNRRNLFRQHQVIPCRVVRQHCPAPFGLNKTKLITISKIHRSKFFSRRLPLIPICSITKIKPREDCYF